MSEFKDIRTKLSAARTRLIVERPFIGTLLMHLPLVPVDGAWCETLATDARTLYFSPRYIDRLDLRETQFALAHVALHCALCHFARRGHRERRRWDIATDHAVNLLLVDDGLTPAPGALLNPAFRDLAAEEIYPLIPSNCGDDTVDQHLLFDAAAESGRLPARLSKGETDSASGGGAIPQAGPDEGSSCGAEERPRHSPLAGTRLPRADSSAREALARLWQGRLVAAAQQARRAGRMGASWERAVNEQVAPQLPWQSLLARFMLGVARDDYSFQRLSRRGGEALLPSLKSGEVDVYVALDTSGSIADGELRQFTTEIDALKGQIRARVTVHACDEALDRAGPWSYHAWEPIALPDTLHGGGGTSFVPIFNWIEREHRRPDLLVYFTDAEGEFPDVPPGYPVVWLVKGRGPVPWGERIQLN